jgi:hypothetical protein
MTYKKTDRKIELTEDFVALNEMNQEHILSLVRTARFAQEATKRSMKSTNKSKQSA